MSVPFWERQAIKRKINAHTTLTRNEYGAWILRQVPWLTGLVPREVVLMEDEMRDLHRAFIEIQREVRETIPPGS